VDTADEAEKFLNPDYENGTYDPFLMTDMEKAVEKIYQTIKDNKRICVYSDYDCDGIPGAVIWHDFFKKINFDNFEIYIPDRHKEGYGLNKDAIKEIANNGANLLITVDLGITAVDEVLYAKEFGIETIITDHHLPLKDGEDDILPSAFAVVNPKRVDDVYPDEMLCGSGVAFKLIQAFLKKHGEEFGVTPGFEKWLLDMVGLATLSDMVPLVKENRVLAHYGLLVLKKTRRPGLLKLLSDSRIKPENLQEDDVTFSITPKINAASRMDVPMRAFDLLSASEDGVAGEHANHLLKINNERKYLVANIVKKIKKTFSKKESKSVIVIGDPSWRIGILGLVAGKMVDEFKRPVFVWGVEGGETIKGSCRSDGSVNLVELMSALPQGSFDDFGGHEGAGGFSVSYEEIHFLEERLVEAYEKVKKDTVEDEGAISAEAIISLDDVNENTFNEINKLAPFGVGNPRPIFEIKDAIVKEVRMFGKTKEHLEILFEN